MRHGTLAGDDRGISPEGVAALGFGITIVMLAVVGAGLLQLDKGLQSKGPVVDTRTDDIHAGSGLNDQWIRIHHVNGDSVAVENMNITVWLPEHRKRATLYDIPTDRMDQSNYEQNHIFMLGNYGIEGAIDSDGGDRDGNWSAGESIGFRITHRRVKLKPGQRVKVTIKHTPTNSNIYQQTLIVED